MTDRTLIQIPFSGFYESMWSQEIDHVEEMEVEHYAGDRQKYDEPVPVELRLDEAEYADLFFRHTDYSAAYHCIAREFVLAFSDWFKSETGIDLALEYESMTSPREYNFQTDRIFAHIPVTAVQALFDHSAADNHERLERVIKARHTSRSGFHSYYGNDLAEWLEKPLEDWDHNELESLLIAAMTGTDEDCSDHGHGQWEWRIF